MLFDRPAPRTPTTVSDVRRRSRGPMGERQTMQERQSLRRMAETEERPSPLSVDDTRSNDGSSSAVQMSPEEWIQRRKWASEAQLGALGSPGFPTSPDSPADRVSAKPQTTAELWAATASERQAAASKIAAARKGQAIRKEVTQQKEAVSKVAAVQRGRVSRKVKAHRFAGRGSQPVESLAAELLPDVRALLADATVAGVVAAAEARAVAAERRAVAAEARAEAAEVRAKASEREAGLMAIQKDAAEMRTNTAEEMVRVYYYSGHH